MPPTSTTADDSQIRAKNSGGTWKGTKMAHLYAKYEFVGFCTKLIRHIYKDKTGEFPYTFCMGVKLGLAQRWNEHRTELCGNRAPTVTFGSKTEKRVEKFV
jgi:hypothetical protein